MVLIFLMCIRVKEKLRSGEMVVAGDQWPIFLYNRYRYDPEDPWNGLFRSVLLVSVSIFTFSRNFCLGWQICARHINTSSHPRVPSKRNQRPPDLETHTSMGWRKSREPLLHTLLLRQVQIILFLFLHISDEYGWNQVRFALSSSPVFSRTDTVTDSERFYNSILDLFEDVEENEEVNDLLLWWNRYALASDQV